MRVLVTGGAGFIGSHIVDKLMLNNCETTVLDNLSTGLRGNVPNDIELLELDVRSKALTSVFEQRRFDAVIHLAAQTMVPVSIEDPLFDCNVNVTGMVNVLEASRKTGVKRVIFSSSAAVYGDVEQVPVKEKAPTAPTSFYGLSKLGAERYLALYQRTYGLDYVVLRYANVYGERQGDGGEGGVISIFTRKLCNDEPLTVFGDGSQTRDFIYAGDVAEANYRALVTPNVNQTYNISTQTETTVNELIAQLETVSKKQAVKKIEAPRKGDIYRSFLENQQAIDGLDWKPATLLTKGLERTYRSLNAKTIGF